MKLKTHSVEKPWGRTSLPAPFQNVPGPDGKRIGEIWFDTPNDEHQPLLVKYIFTSEKLSVQVHPDDAQGRARGLAGGKSECWYILDAEPGATLGLGTTRPLDDEELRTAALDGSIETLMDWKAVKPGDFFYVPAGTVHAIGAGVSLVEIQQNVDVTYRLYDYGRPRELHLDDGIAVSVAQPYPASLAKQVAGHGTQLLVETELFSVLYTDNPAAVREAYADRGLWVVPLAGAVSSDGDHASAGECLWVAGTAPLVVDGPCRCLLGVAPA